MEASRLQHGHRILTNPAYGGAYAYGKTENMAVYDQGVSVQRTRRRPRDRWIALIPGAHEGYVSWEQFERIQKMIVGNRLSDYEPSGAARRGSGLLTGLLRCRRCSRTPSPPAPTRERLRSVSESHRIL